MNTFRRSLIGGLGVFLVGLAIALVFPGPMLRHLGVPLTILGILLGLGVLSYGVAYAYRERMRRVPPPTSSTVERVFVAGWILVVGLLLGALLFPRQTWVPSPEVLLTLCFVVVLSSMGYAAFLAIRHLIRRLRRD